MVRISVKTTTSMETATVALEFAACGRNSDETRDNANIHDQLHSY